MARKRIEGTTLESWDDVNTCLKEIGQVDRELALLEAAQNEEIDKIKAGTLAAAQTLAGKKKGLEMAIKEFTEANRVDLGKAKTRELTFGALGFRSSTSIVIKKVAETLQFLKDFGHKTCIRTKEEPDKEAMKNLTDEQLAEVGAARKTSNTFWYEVKQEEIKEAA